ncbi:hypothetical protein GCM10009689_31500 [Brevibacterium antiquum]|uniref:hypothetical protein n=1 Tax=Brevibacterium antiquum TaxID=234835 RepID=UPI0018DFD5BF|nr:hypothetical protein [Brevibacterium antiquum]
MDKCCAFGCKLAAYFSVGVLRIIYVSCKTHQHVQSEVVVSEYSRFMAVSIGANVGSEAVISRPLVSCSAINDAHPERHNDTGCRNND